MNGALPKILTVGGIAAVFAAGIGWNDLKRDVSAAEAKAEEATEQAAAAVRATDRIGALEQDMAGQKWALHQVLRKVNPEAAEMIPPPPNPYERSR